MSEVKQLEQQLSNAKALIEKRDIALRLFKNRDFRKLILDEYMVQEAARYVQCSGDPALGKEERADALLMAQSTGCLKRWLSVTVRMGNQAESEIGDLDDEIAEARAEADAEEAEAATDQTGE